MNLIKIEQHNDGVLVVDSRLVADNLGLEHESYMATIYNHQAVMEQAFGVIRFEFSKPLPGSKGGRPIKYALLTEDQATFSMTNCRNTDQVLQCKVGLVQGFSRAKQMLAEIANGQTTQPSFDTEIRKLELQVELARIELERDRMRLAITQPKEFYREPKNQPAEAVPAKKTAKDIIKDIPADEPAACRISIAGDPVPAVQMFVDECLEITFNWADRLTNEEIQKAYVEYCDATYSPRMGYPRFINYLKELLPGCHQQRRKQTHSENPGPNRGWVPAHWVKLKIKPHPRVTAG